MRKIILILIFLISWSGVSLGQQTGSVKGHVTVIQDSSIAQLMRRNAALNESRQSMPGFRIQVYFGTDRAKANEIRSEFIKDHPDTEAYLIYHQPNFKVRLGDFKTRLEALKAMSLISAFYPAAFIVKDEVRLPKTN